MAEFIAIVDRALSPKEAPATAHEVLYGAALPDTRWILNRVRARLLAARAVVSLLDFLSAVFF
jgi:hypothetical protein